MLPEPPCQRPTDALSRSLSSPLHPDRHHQAPPRPVPPVSHAHPVTRVTQARQSGVVANHRASPPPLLLLPPPRGRAHADPPFLLSASCHRATFQKRHPVPLFRPFSSRPRSSHRSRALHPRAKVPVAFPSITAPSSVRIWPSPPLSSLSSVRRPPSISSPNPRPSLTSLYPSDL
jgi:hypothetical protein